MNSRTTLSISEVCKTLGIGRSTLYVLIKEGRLPVRKLGNRTLILRSDLENFVSALPLGRPHHDSATE
ncbi:hypothetical protein CU102_23135 [Phyllobacterium brassicacearum]|uniref:Helix-turn-helix domain-containing protein n=1 Tax=Phyllobacterium brassicacearum TaxID=314235 RepID=A0A2P7BBD8_9HYPH|nr:helix-turn-helix domain-containing protein [Phyllobacterium brassicacearum]PSH63756.1 hypothetical protein CU102_23135 [Phyllobacterium brassicacearum]TDQ31961.1 excisionase family DNA binding protein [Phyllobacterium brassicacearum]